MTLITISMNPAIAKQKLIEGKILALYHKLRDLLLGSLKNAVPFFEFNEPNVVHKHRIDCILFQSVQFMKIMR